MKQVHNINSSTLTVKKHNKISLNKYFNISQINKDNSTINNNTIKTIYYHNKYSKNKKIHSNKKNNSKNIINRNKFNSYISRKYKNRLTYDSNYIYQEAGEIINNNINNNVNKIKKEKELLQLKKKLNELKTNNNKIKKDLSLIKKQNMKLEIYKNNVNQKIYFNIKNILKYNDNDNDINNKLNENILNIIKINKYKSLPLKEKNNLIRNMYLNEKLKNSLIDKTCLLFLKFNGENKSKSGINGSDVSFDIDVDGNLYNIYKWITSVIENIEQLKNNNEKIQININNLNEEKEICKKYCNSWLNMLGINKKEELIKKIDFLINYKNINSNEEAKMFKMLLNKKD